MPDPNPSSSSGDTDVSIVLVTFPTLEAARQVGAQVVEQNLAACVNLIPQAESIYRWQGRIERDAEVVALFKTSSRRVGSLQGAIETLHPYDVPEVIAVQVDHGSPSYLRWVVEETREWATD